MLLQVVTPGGGSPPDYIILDVNPAFESISGISKEELIGRKMSALSSNPCSAYFDWAEIEHALSNAVNSTQQFVRYSNIMERCCEITAWSDQAGCLAVITRDITSKEAESEKAEQDLMASEQRYRGIVEDQTELICRFRPDNTLTFVNDAYCRYFNKREEDLLGEPFTLLIPLEDQGIVVQNHAKINPENPVVEYEHRVILPDGDIRWQHWVDRAFFDEQGNVTEYQAVGRDITERKQVEEQLRKSEEKFRSLVENLTEVVYALDEQARIDYVSPNVKSIAGYDPTEVLGRPFTDFVHPEDLPGRLEQFQKVLSGIIEYTEYRFLTKDGQAKWVRTAARPVYKGDRLEGIHGVLADITERKKAEETIHYMSFHDQLTGLYNRYFMEEEMRRLDTARQLPLSIIMADLNGLKLVNDTYGHEVGDEMLQKAAFLLKESCRKEDIIARWGGDEFIIFLPQAPVEVARSLCQRVEEACDNSYVKDIPLSMALGFACKTDMDKDLKMILKEAEDNMYKQKLGVMRSNKSNILTTLLKTLEEKSYETEAHTQGMRRVAKKLGEKMSLPGNEMRRLDVLITLHDIGKINIPEEILTKKGSLTDEEWAVIKKHPEIGFRITRATEEFAHVAEDILAHHEYWDGNGYPRGLMREEIPLLARITAIADAFEVMSRGRPYKKALELDEIITEFKRCSGSQFDPQLVNLLLSILEDEKIYQELK